MPMSVLMHGTSVPRVVKSTRESRSSRPPKRGGVVVPLSIKLINGDLAAAALEGMTEDQKAKVRRRAAWLADRFIRNRARSEKLFCDSCGFDPKSKIADTSVTARSLLDVHHMNPLEEGVRYTTEADFCLVCPNCHRFMHRLARTLTDPDAKANALRPPASMDA